MRTNILLPTDKNIALCAKIINQGGLVAFATETVYGLGADATNPNAVLQIYRVKGRPADNPLIVHLVDAGDIDRVAAVSTRCARQLIDAFMPGPLTLVLIKSPIIPGEVTCGLDTVGVRIPANLVARKFIMQCGVPVAAPSANVSGRPSPTTAQAVLKDLSGKIQYILDGGDSEIGIESTVADVTGEVPVVLRPGAVTCDDILSVCGSVSVACAGARKDMVQLQSRSPGTRYRHYAPSCNVILVKNKDARSVLGAIKQGTRSVFIGFEDTFLQLKQLSSAKNFAQPAFISLGDGAESAARNLYGALNEAEKGFDTAVLECAPDTPLGFAVNDRMKRAAGFVE